jgi:hypothetical protein
MNILNPTVRSTGDISGFTIPSRISCLFGILVFAAVLISAACASSKSPDRARRLSWETPSAILLRQPS